MNRDSKPTPNWIRRRLQALAIRAEAAESRVAALEAALRGLMIEPSQLTETYAEGGDWKEALLDEWVCNHCGESGPLDAIAHAADCPYVAARAALAGAPRPKAECETNDTNAPEGAKEEP